MGTGSLAKWWEGLEGMFGSAQAFIHKGLVLFFSLALVERKDVFRGGGRHAHGPSCSRGGVVQPWEQWAVLG